MSLFVPIPLAGHRSTRHSMHIFPTSIFNWTPQLMRCSVLLVVSTLVACSSISNQTLSGLIKPYKSEVIQGNFVSSEQVAALRVGMSKNQVRYILGTPLLTDVFHAERWDYVFTIERDGVASKTRRLTVYFRGDQLERWDSDPMPSEAEFAQTLTPDRQFGKPPPLVATEKQLADFAQHEKQNQKALSTVTQPDKAASDIMDKKSYPPLEAE